MSRVPKIEHSAAGIEGETNMTATIGFHGGAGTVTGSRYLVEAGGTSCLVDSGLFQGLKELRLLNWQKPSFDPGAVRSLVLTHAHIDHSGYLPKLVRDGFRGPIYCTPATQELAQLMLLDAAHLQEEDALYANRRGFSKHSPAQPLYTTADAQQAINRLSPVEYHDWITLGDGFRARFLNAGHILGSAHVEMEIPDGPRTLRVVWSGDVGRYDAPLHPDPSPLPPCDALVIESTYGDRLHDAAPPLQQLEKPFRQACERGGTILIPCFAVGRAQMVTMLLGDGMRDGTLPQVPIHIDSPMAVDATRIYAKHVGDENLDPDVLQNGQNRLFPKGVHFHRSVDESKALNTLAGPRVILSASGMLTGGRVVHHLHRILGDERSLIVLVGYQAAGTRGRALLEGRHTIRMHGQDVPVRARLLSMQGLSAHADADELLRWVRSSGAPPRQVFVTHGEPASSTALAARLERELGVATHLPRLGQSFDLSALVSA